MKNPRHRPLNWKGKLFVVWCFMIIPTFFIAWPWAFVMMFVMLGIMDSRKVDFNKPILHYCLYYEPKKDTIGYRLAQICAPRFYLKKSFGRGSWCLHNPLWRFKSVRSFYRSRTGQQDYKLHRACIDFIEEYATTQLGKTALEFVSALGCQPDRLKDLRSWAHIKHRISLEEVIVDGPMLLKRVSKGEIKRAERDLQRAIDDANRFPSRARQVILQGTQQALDDLRDRPRYENGRIEHYIKIAYYDYPGFNKSEIRKKFIEDWNPQGLGMR